MALLVSAPPVLLERAGYTAKQVAMILAERDAAAQAAQQRPAPPEQAASQQGRAG
jgi:hypothetical protein